MSKDTYFSVHNYYEIESPNGHIFPVPVQIGVDSLAEELELCIRVVSTRNSVSYRTVPVAELMISMLLDKLQVYYQNYPEEAQMAAKRMIRILESIDTDDDVFPYGQITAIQSIAHIA